MENKAQIGAQLCVETVKVPNLLKCFFSSRVINSWNGLPQDVIEATSVNMFKNRLDKLWKNMGVYSGKITL